MSDRLKQIWSGFSGTTNRNLTGRGVDNILVPHRTDYSSVDAAFLPENFSTPAAAAFSALRENLSKKEKLFSAKKKKDVSMPSEPAAVADATAFTASSDELIRGLRATAMRVERPELDYGAFLESREGRAHFKKHKRKKLFGIF